MARRGIASDRKEYLRKEGLSNPNTLLTDIRPVQTQRGVHRKRRQT